VERENLTFLFTVFLRMTDDTVLYIRKSGVIVVGTGSLGLGNTCVGSALAHKKRSSPFSSSRENPTTIRFINLKPSGEPGKETLYSIYGSPFRLPQDSREI
jgi:hypothetical protein